MKYVSYFIIFVVILLSGWTIDTSIHAIFAKEEKIELVSIQPPVQVIEEASFSESLDSLFSN